MQERSEHHSRYNFRRNGQLDVHGGPLGNMTFNSTEDAFGILAKAEDIANNISSGLKFLSIPIVVASSVEAGFGLKEKRAPRVIKGLACIVIGIGVGSRFGLAKLFEKMADTYSLEKDNIEEAFFNQSQAA